MRDGRHRVVQVTGYYPPHLGGVELVSQALAHHLDRAGVEVEVLTTRVGARGLPRRRVEDGVRVTRHRAAYLAHTPLSPGLLLGLLGQPRGTVVHAHVAQAALAELVAVACLLRGLRWVAHVHLDVDPTGRLGGLLRPWKRWILGPALRRATRVLTLTEEMGRVVVRDHRVDPRRVRVLRNGVDEMFFAAGTLAPGARPTRGSAQLRVLYAGRLATQKNVGRLVDAIALTAAAVDLTIVGDGDQRARLEGEVAERGLGARIGFAGQVSRQELVRRMRAADVLVLPSDREGMPLVLLEAMAAGLAVLATDVPGSHELLADCGGLVRPDAPALAEALDRLVCDPDALTDLGRRQAVTVARHRWPLVCEELQRVYAEVRSS